MHQGHKVDTDSIYIQMVNDMCIRNNVAEKKLLVIHLRNITVMLI